MAVNTDKNVGEAHADFLRDFMVYKLTFNCY